MAGKPLVKVTVVDDAALPALHADPFDRILLVQAVTEGMTLMTADARLLAYGGPVTGA